MIRISGAKTRSKWNHCYVIVCNVVVTKWTTIWKDYLLHSFHFQKMITGPSFPMQMRIFWPIERSLSECVCKVRVLLIPGIPILWCKFLHRMDKCLKMNRYFYWFFEKLGFVFHFLLKNCPPKNFLAIFLFDFGICFSKNCCGKGHFAIFQCDISIFFLDKLLGKIYFPRFLSKTGPE